MHNITSQSKMLALWPAASLDEDSSGQQKSSGEPMGTAVVRKAAAAVQKARWRVADRSAQELLPALAAAGSRPRLVFGLPVERTHKPLAPAVAENTAELQTIVPAVEALSTCAFGIALVAVAEFQMQGCWKSVAALAAIAWELKLEEGRRSKVAPKVRDLVR